MKRGRAAEKMRKKADLSSHASNNNSKALWATNKSSVEFSLCGKPQIPTETEGKVTNKSHGAETLRCSGFNWIVSHELPLSYRTSAGLWRCFRSFPGGVTVGDGGEPPTVAHGDETNTEKSWLETFQVPLSHCFTHHIDRIRLNKAGLFLQTSFPFMNAECGCLRTQKPHKSGNVTVPHAHLLVSAESPSGGPIL